MQRTTLIQRLNEVIRLFQIANDFIVRQYGTQVSQSLEGQILMQVEADEAPAIDSLVKALNLPQPTVSRSVKYLVDRKLLIYKKSSEDKRQRLVTLSAGGKRALDKWHEARNAAMNVLASRFSKEELKHLVAYQARFADGLGADTRGFTRRVPPMRVQVVRITRGLELLRSDLYHPFGLSMLEWHILKAISEDNGNLVAKDITELFGAPVNTVATALKSLEVSNFVLRTRDPSDGRRRYLKVTAAGRILLKRIEAPQLKTLRGATAGFSDSELEEFVVLSERFFENRGFASGTGFDFQIKLIVEEAEVNSGRRFLVDHILSETPDAGLPGHLLAPDNHTFGLYEDAELCGLCEISPSGEVVNLAVAAEYSGTISEEEFEQACIERSR